MSTIANLGFEDAGTGPGFADVWNVENVTARGFFAEFANLRAVEDFESGWTNDAYETEHDPLSPRALFSGDFYVAPVSAESFEAGWTNTSYMLTSFAAIGAVFDPSSEPFESFDEGWDNSPYLYAFSGGDLEAAVFDGNGFENFEQSWGNTGYALEWVGGETTAAVLSGILAKTVEDFEDVKPPAVYTGDDINDSIVSVGHGLAAGYSLILAPPVAGAMPGPLAPSIRYFVTFVIDPDNVNVGLAPAGPTVDLTNAGSGLLLWSDPWEFWTTLMATI